VLFLHDTLGPCRCNQTSVMARSDFNREFRRDAGYCIDAPTLLAAGSTERFDPAPDDLFEAFAAPRIAHRF
jgi:hypothetical protein